MWNHRLLFSFFSSCSFWVDGIKEKKLVLRLDVRQHIICIIIIHTIIPTLCYVLKSQPRQPLLDGSYMIAIDFNGSSSSNTNFIVPWILWFRNFKNATKLIQKGIGIARNLFNQRRRLGSILAVVGRCDGWEKLSLANNAHKFTITYRNLEYTGRNPIALLGLLFVRLTWNG